MGLLKDLKIILLENVFIKMIDRRFSKYPVMNTFSQIKQSRQQLKRMNTTMNPF